MRQLIVSRKDLTTCDCVFALLNERLEEKGLRVPLRIPSKTSRTLGFYTLGFYMRRVLSFKNGDLHWDRCVLTGALVIRWREPAPPLPRNAAMTEREPSRPKAIVHIGTVEEVSSFFGRVAEHNRAATNKKGTPSQSREVPLNALRRT